MLFLDAIRQYAAELLMGRQMANYLLILDNSSFVESDKLCMLLMLTSTQFWTYTIELQCKCAIFGHSEVWDQ